MLCDVVFDLHACFIERPRIRFMSSTLPVVDTRLRPSNLRAIVAVSIGNALEWYDFILYATFAAPISHAFFPGKDEFTSLLVTFITFGISFGARPVGAAVLGGYADRAGRKAALTVTVLLMASGSLIIAVCPTAATIGVAAPIILFLARLLQGFSAGGEIGGAMALLAEDAPPRRRCFYLAFQGMGQGAAIVLCGVAALVVNSCFSVSQVNAWAWRLPFFFGIVIAPVGFYIRRHVAEPELFSSQRDKPTPLRWIFAKHLKSLLIAGGLGIIGTVGSYVTLYIPTYAHNVLGISRSNSLIPLIVVGCIAMASPLAGIFADRFHRKSLMLLAAFGLVVCPYPAFYYLTRHPTIGTLLAVLTILALLLTIYTAAAIVLLTEIFPTSARATGIGLAYSLTVAIFGGFTPAIVSALMVYTGNKLMIGVWMTICGVLSFVALLFAKDRSQMELT